MIMALEGGIHMSACFQKAAMGLLVVLLFALLVSGAVGVFAAQFTPPTNITVQMYQLNQDGSLPPPDSRVPCASGNTSWGCTAFCNNYPSPDPCSSPSRPYPYITSTVAVSIENDYLLDVIPQEMNPATFHPNAIYAQAIAARSFAYYHIYQGNAINNSADFQVFVPYKFESLFPATDPNNPNIPCASTNLNTSQRTVCDATASRYYITYYVQESPAFTEFFADRQYRTLSNPPYPYLLGVEDPISIYPPDMGHGRGLSQYGASRWARGNTCGDTRYNCAPWSVQWRRLEQILVHYYTAIYIRDANSTILTPNDRWNPLWIDWGTPNNQPPTMWYGNTYPVTISVQNTSTYDWARFSGQQWGLSYHWAKAGFGEIDSNNRSWATMNVPRGDPPYTYTVTINDIPNWGPGIYILKFDIFYESGESGGNDYWFRYYGWSTYDVVICVGKSCRFMPVLMKNYAGW